MTAKGLERLIGKILAPIRRATLRYFIAVQMNAGASTPGVFFADQYESPVPIVRPIPSLTDGKWDQREILRHRDSPGVLTKPIHDIYSGGSTLIHKN